MAPKLLLLFTVLLAFQYDLVEGRPSHIEATTVESFHKEDTVKEDRSVHYLMDANTGTANEGIRNIVEKVKAVNDGLTKPQIQKNKYNEPKSSGEYVLDKDTLDKIKQTIATGKLYPDLENKKYHGDSYLQNLDDRRLLNSRNIKILPELDNSPYPTVNPLMGYPYITNLPVLVMPSPQDVYSKYTTNNNIRSVLNNQMYQTRQQQPQQPLFPGFPLFSLPSFQFQSPLSSIFPVLIKDPWTALTQGGGWENFLEYGQSADVCSRKQKSLENDLNESSEEEMSSQEDREDTTSNDSNENVQDSDIGTFRQSRAYKKKTIAEATINKKTDNRNNSKTVYISRPVSNRKSTRKPLPVTPSENIRPETLGNFRLPFSDFTWYGDRKPIAPSPGFFINKLRVRKGGVAIAGPGGIATAGNGGTAIVGAGGLAYTKPGGLAVAGPQARIIALTADSDFGSVISRLNANSTKVESYPRHREGKLVATGPTIYYHPLQET